MLTVLLLFGCTGDPPGTVIPDTCPVEASPRAELSQTDTWGMPDGTPVSYGIPPQGGAPYAPFDVRTWGLPGNTDPYAVEMEAVDVGSGEVIGEGSYDQRFVCANVPPNAGSRVSGEVHMRFFGFEPDEIEGRTVDVMITVTAPSGEEVSAGFQGPLDWVLGPLPD